MKASFEGVASYYEADEPSKDRPTLELALAEEIYNAYHSLEDANECLVIACRLTDRKLRERWRRKARR